jgi:hypothetical protein
MWVYSRRRPSIVPNFSADGTRVDAWQYFPDFKVGNYFILFLLFFSILSHELSYNSEAAQLMKRYMGPKSRWFSIETLCLEPTWQSRPWWHSEPLLGFNPIFIGLIRDPPQVNPNLRLDFPSRHLSVRPMPPVKMDSKWTDFNSSFENVNLPWKDIYSGKLCHSEFRAEGGLWVFG